MLPSTVYCDTCGAANRPQARFCIACGKAMAPASSLPPTIQASPIVTSTPPTVLAGPTPSSPSFTGRLPANSLLKQRYLILSRLGQGGMGAVYKAADTQLGDRLVAVKEMSQKGLDAQEIVEAAETFKQEALMLAGLPHHPNLPSIYDHFAEGGRWYLVMDFIAGQTLEEHLARAKGGYLPVEEVLDIGIQLCTVLGYLHQHKPPIIFRDLKPANVMRTADGHLYLIDFGIARNFKQGQAKDTIAYGSAGYAAPEQYGKAQTTQQSDIYSLGATLHYLLSGTDPSQTPFDFAPLTNSPIPAGLSMLIAQMVETKVDKRPASMAEVKQALQRIATQPAGSQLPPTQYAGGASLPPTPPASNLPLPPTQRARVFFPLGTLHYTYRGHAVNVEFVVWSPDGMRIASGNVQGMDVWDVVTGRKTFSGACAHGGIAWSPDGGRIAYGFSPLVVCDALTGHIIRQLAETVTALAWSPDGTQIVFSDNIYKKTIFVTNATTGKNMLIFGGHQKKDVYSLAWSPDGRRIASGSDDNTVQAWDAMSGRTLCTYRGHSSYVRGVVWSPDGRRIASGSWDKTAQVWEASTGKHIFTYRGHSGDVHAVSWSPDGKYIASASQDKTVQVWEANTGKPVYTYRGHSDMVNAVAWSPDGTRIASGSGNTRGPDSDTTVQVWQAE
jgi:eukaryotic-like serine/threonine-protein kinase